MDGVYQTDCPGQALPSAELCDAGQVDENCDGAANEGCGCAPVESTAPCCSGRGVQTCLATTGGSAYSACSVTPDKEVCNGIDDDCDGLVDEEDSPLCGAGGACLSGACGCAGGAAPLDCLVDADEDLRSPDLSALTSLCAVADRPDQGGCPAGFVLPAFAKGLDCDDTDPTRLSLQSLRADQDGDGACVGAVTVACIGAAAPAGQRLAAACQAADDCDDASAAVFQLASLRDDADGDAYCTSPASSQCIGSATPAGRRLTATCQPTDDCNDTSAAAFVLATLRADADADSYCIGAASSQCVGASPPAGFRLLGACQATDDCNDASAAAFQLVTLRVDADADAYCVGAAANQCVGASTPAGLRIPGACQPTDDCNDTSAAAFQLLTVRTDADADGYCVGTAASQCVGASLPAGLRIATTCVGDDCRDSNPLANLFCVIPVGYATTSVVKACIFVPPTETFTVSSIAICPFGFQIDPASIAAQRLAGTGTCTALSATSLSATCNGVDGATCRVVAACVAL